MTDSGTGRGNGGADPSIDLTQSLRSLRVPVHSTPSSDTEDQNRWVMLFTRDSGAAKWARRWLGHAGFDTVNPADHRDGLSLARAERPDVIVVEAALSDKDGELLYQSLLAAADLTVPVMVLCANARELSTAKETDAVDVVRRPYEWQLIARRVRTIVDLDSARAKLEVSNQSLRRALELADAARQRLRSRESFEPVTGLPNKGKFVDLLGKAMSAVDRDHNRLAVFVIGFNRFRLVVEAMGQEHTDRIMAEVGKTLSQCLLDADRPAADGPGLKTAVAGSLEQFRFGVMFSYPGETAEIERLRQQFLERLARPIQVSGQTIYLSACIGIAEYPGDAADVDSLLQRADNAMREAQSRGGGFKYYCAETDAAAARRLRIEHMLHEALDQNQLTLAYQPIQDLRAGKAMAAEALLRWTRADGETMRPDEFVPVAEDSGMMVRLGRFVLEQACRQLAAWRQAGITLPVVSVNVSRVQLTSSDFVGQVRQALTSTGLPPTALELELSERGVLGGDVDVLSQLHDLKDLGVRLAIDDFGTGAAAIAYLKELPVDVLKIDRSYTAGMINNPKEAAITSAMIMLGQSLGLKVVAEGVETTEQLEALRALGCDACQGFLLARPTDSRSVVEYL